MMSIKALATTVWALIIIVIILAGGLVGVVYYYTIYKAPAPGVPVPGFVNSNTLILEGGASPQWLDPHVSYYQYDYEIMQESVEMLLWYNGSSSTQIIPWLTQSWTPSYTAASNNYTVTLRSGIKFQDGTPLNSTAVYFSLNRLLILDGTSDTETHGSQAAWIVQQLLDTSLSSALSGKAQSYNQTWVKKVLAQNFIQIINDTTFKINIKRTTTQFPYLLSQPWAAIVSPSEVIKKEYAFPPNTKWGDPSEAFANMTKYFVHAAGEGHTYYNVPKDGWKMGTGPYYLDSYDPTTYRVVLKVNPNYWGGPSNFQYPIGTPKIKEIDFDYVESFATRLLDLKAETATGIGVSAADIYSVIDKGTWLTNGTFKSLIPGVTIHGPFPQFTSDWFNFITNVTDVSGKLLTFQPMADRRIRLAIADAVNVTEINIDVNNRLGQVANNLIPPGTAPAGSYNASLTIPWSFNLKESLSLLQQAMKQPITSFTFYNGTRIPSGVIDNNFGEEQHTDGVVRKAYDIPMYVGSADTLDQKLLTTVATNLNKFAPNVADGGNATGLTFTVVPVPGGQQYTLASEHTIYMYWGGWVADYNHVIDWLAPMYLSTGTYFSWNLMNYTKLDGYVTAAQTADTKGDLTGLLTNVDLANKFANDNVLYFYTFYPVAYFVRSSFLKGWYFNEALSTEYFAPMHYETTP
jgi:ABC-type transport system substrate-binding protein